MSEPGGPDKSSKRESSQDDYGGFSGGVGGPFEPKGHQPTRFELVVGLGFIGICYGLLIASMLIDFSPAKFAVVTFLLSWPLLLVIHDFAHAAVAWSLNWQVCRIVIGFGKKWFEFKIGRVPVEVRVVPISGYILPAPRTLSGVRVKDFLVSFAGPGSEILVIVGLAAWLGTDQLFSTDVSEASWTVMGARGVMVAAFYGVIMNLLPLAMQSLSGPIYTDGMRMLMAWVVPLEFYEQIRAMPLVLDAQKAAADGDHEMAAGILRDAMEQFDNPPALRHALAKELEALREYDEAAEHYQTLIADEKVPEPWRDQVQHDLAWCALLRGSELSCKAAREHMHELVGRHPKEPRYLVTQGIAMVETGWVERGIELIRKHAAHLATNDEKMHAAAYLAIGEAEQGNDEFARALRDQVLADAGEAKAEDVVIERLRERVV